MGAAYLAGAPGEAAQVATASAPYTAPAPYADSSAPGVIEGADGERALSVLAPLGRLSVAQWRLLTGVADADGVGALRLTPWRGIVIPGLSADTADARLRELSDAGLITGPDSPGTTSAPAPAAPAAPSPVPTCGPTRRPRSGRAPPYPSLSTARSPCPAPATHPAPTTAPSRSPAPARASRASPPANRGRTTTPSVTSPSTGPAASAAVATRTERGSMCWRQRTATG